MEERNRISISLPTLFLIIVIIILAIKGCNWYKNNIENQIESTLKNEDYINNTDEVKELENTNSKEDEIKYIEMTEENYKKYNSNGYQFKISDMLDNKDNTVTIKGRVYKLKELPILSKEQFQDCINGKAITVMGYEMEMNGSEDADNYDFVIESTTEDWLKFYVDKNDDGTGKLILYSEIGIYEGTDVYMQLIVDNSILTESGRGKIPLKQYLENLSGEMQELKKIEILPDYNTEIVFKDKKCKSILFTSI